MSLRSAAAAKPLAREPQEQRLAALVAAQTITAACPIAEAHPASATPYVPFQPEYRAPKHVPDVVGALFDDVGTDDTDAMFGRAGRALAGAKERAIKAKDAAKAAVGNVRKAGADWSADVGSFDYEITPKDSMVVGAIKKGWDKKSGQATVVTKNEVLPWHGMDTTLAKAYKSQRDLMYKLTEQDKSKQDGDVTSFKWENKPHVVCMGYYDPAKLTEEEQKEPRETVQKAINALIYNPKAAKRPGAPLLVHAPAILDAHDDEGNSVIPTYPETEVDKQKWKCVTGMLVEAVVEEDLFKNADDRIPLKFADAKEHGGPGAYSKMIDVNGLDDIFCMSVRGLHVTSEKQVVLGPRIYVPKARKDMNNLFLYGVAVDGQGIVRASEGAFDLSGGIDLRMLWSAGKFAQGLNSLYVHKMTSKTIKEKLKPMFGGYDGIVVKNSISYGYEDALTGTSVEGCGLDEDEHEGSVLTDLVF
jgi:hypothetical protein